MADLSDGALDRIKAAHVEDSQDKGYCQECGDSVPCYISALVEALRKARANECNNPLRSEITCADLVRENDTLRAKIAAVRAQIKGWSEKWRSDMADEAANAGTESGRYNARVYRDMMADFILALTLDGVWVDG